MKEKIARFFFGPCTHLWLAISVRHDMTIEPCACADMPPDHIFSANNDILSVWNNEKYQATRRYVCSESATYKDAAFSRCVTCPVRGRAAYPFILWRQWKAVLSPLHPLRTARKLFNYARAILGTFCAYPNLPYYPVYANICPGNICQLKCPFCGIGSGEDRTPKGMLSYENFEKVIAMLGPNLLHLNLYRYGEPLLNKDIYKMVRRANDFGIYTQISTNLQKFGPEEARELSASGLDRLVVCADGLDQESYALYRRGGKYETFLSNLKMAIQARREARSKFEICWQFLVFRHNENQLPQARALAKELGVKFQAVPAFIKLEDEYRDWIPTNDKYSFYSKNNNNFKCRLETKTEIHAHPNESINISVTGHNTGASEWTPPENDQISEAIRIGARLFDRDKKHLGDFARGDFSSKVPPGASSDVVINCRVPAQPGPYYLKVDLLKENVFWFENLGNEPIWIKLFVE